MGIWEVRCSRDENGNLDLAGKGGLLEDGGSEGGGDRVELMGGEAGRLEKLGRDDEIGHRRECRGDKPGLGG